MCILVEGGMARYLRPQKCHWASTCCGRAHQSSHMGGPTASVDGWAMDEGVFAGWERSWRVFQQGAACTKPQCNVTLWRTTGHWVQEELSWKCSWTHQLCWNLPYYRIWALLQPSRKLPLQIRVAGRQLSDSHAEDMGLLLPQFLSSEKHKMVDSPSPSTAWMSYTDSICVLQLSSGLRVKTFIYFYRPHGLGDFLLLKLKFLRKIQNFGFIASC